MSATVKLSSRLPGDPEINGLDGLHERLCVDETPILCYAWVKPTRVVEDLATQERVPTVELARIEPIGPVTSLDQSYIEDVADRYEKRTGRNPLPIGALLAPSGDVGQLKEEPTQIDEDVADFMARRPQSGAEVFVFEGGGDDE